ncbi:hypothetical protein OSTOST_08139, partial [Ostertagia ostertagi]
MSLVEWQLGNHRIGNIHTGIKGNEEANGGLPQHAVQLPVHCFTIRQACALETRRNFRDSKEHQKGLF